MKKIIALALTLVMVFALFAVGGGTAFADDEGKVFNIYAWNEEFKGFFEKYYTVPEGVTVNWIITPSDNGAYQQKLDEALLNQANAADDEKVDLFLAEADYILKYVDSEATQDITALGVTDFSNTYTYTVQAASDAAGCQGPGRDGPGLQVVSGNAAADLDFPERCPGVPFPDGVPCLG